MKTALRRHGTGFHKSILLGLFALSTVQTGCAPFESPAPSRPDPKTVAPKAPTTTVKDPNKELEKVGKDWLYGPGFGRTVLNVGTVVVFPPYAIYLLGNAILDVSGYEQLHITDALPEGPKEGVLSVYNGVTSVPGRTAAGIAGEEYKKELEKAVPHGASGT